MSTKTDETLVVTPEHTNGYEEMIPQHIVNDIREYRDEHPDAEKAPWAAVVAYCFAGSGNANFAMKGDFVAIYAYAAREYTDDAQLPFDVGRVMDDRRFPTLNGGVEEAAESLRRELRAAYEDGQSTL